MPLIFYPDGTGLYKTTPNYLILSGKAKGFKMIQKMFSAKVKWGLVNARQHAYIQKEEFGS